jgi:hypothetical protein
MSGNGSVTGTRGLLNGGKPTPGKTEREFPPVTYPEGLARTDR